MEHNKHWWLGTIDHRAVFTDDNANYTLVWEDGYKTTETYEAGSEVSEKARKDATQKLGIECKWFFQPK